MNVDDLDVNNHILSNELIKKVFKYLENNNMNDCLIGGGCIRNIIWNLLYGHPENYGISDIDIVYYDTITKAKYENAVDYIYINDYKLQFKNQAFIHDWINRTYNINVPQLQSLKEAVASWSEVCSCIAIGPASKYKLVIPYGLEDIKNKIVQPNSQSLIPYTKERFIARVQKMELEPKYNCKIILP